MMRFLFNDEFTCVFTLSHWFTAIGTMAFAPPEFIFKIPTFTATVAHIWVFPIFNLVPKRIQYTHLANIKQEELNRFVTMGHLYDAKY